MSPGETGAGGSFSPSRSPWPRTRSEAGSTGGAEGVPPEWLDGSPFETYLVPSLVHLVVGGTMAAAAAAPLSHRRRAPTLSIGAGVVLLVWLAIEMLIIPLSWLQPVFLVVALLVIGLGLRARAG